MRVVCIDESQQGDQEGPSVKKGTIYTVIDRLSNKEMIVPNGFRPAKGEYYTLAEMGSEYAFHHSLFIPINEDQQDETTFEREYNLEPVKHIHQ